MKVHWRCSQLRCVFTSPHRCFWLFTSATMTSISQRSPSLLTLCAVMWWSFAKSLERWSVTWQRCGVDQVQHGHTTQAVTATDTPPKDFTYVWTMYGLIIWTSVSLYTMTCHRLSRVRGGYDMPQAIQGKGWQGWATRSGSTGSLFQQLLATSLKLHKINSTVPTPYH